MADYRLTRPAAAQIDQILDWGQDRFGDGSRERYAALLVTAMEDVARHPMQATVRWRRVGVDDIGLYHISHSRTNSPDPPGPVGEPRHFMVFRVGADGIVDILGFIHERMLPSRALRRVLRSNDEVR